MIYRERIKKIRELRCFKQSYVAMRLGVTQQAYSAYELNTKDMKLCNLVKVAKILEVDLFLIVCEEFPISTHTINLKLLDIVSQALINKST